MPLDVLSTNFKLAAFKDGWQVRILIGLPLALTEGKLCFLL